MMYPIAAWLSILWLACLVNNLVSSHTIGGWIHVVLLIAVVIVISRVSQEQRAH